ncbi:MAG: putative lipid II flippase FtsW [Burkholderiales bacterium]|nr:putative lipid II flippase FtsW [Burkholderiales bacterium]
MRANPTRAARAGSRLAPAAIRAGILSGFAARGRATPAEYDRGLVWSALLLLTLGLVMVYSASIATAEAARYTGNDPAFFLTRHLAAVAIGLFCAALAFQVPVRAWQRAAPWLFLLGVALLTIVLVPGIGREVNGARRWIALPGANLQPSELMKVAAVLYAADYTARKTARLHSFRDGLLPMLGVMLVVGWLLLREPDFGAFVVIALTATGILFVGGMNARWFAGLTALMLAGFAGLVLSSPYRMQRIFGFMDPWSDAFGNGYQLSHALIAFGRGEWLGVGLGASVEKLFYLPEAHTDFLLAVIGEELGFVGVLTVLGLFAWLVLRAFAIGRQAVALERPFAALVAQGVGVWFGVQAFINMGVNMGVLPTKGLTLPLMSFGGTAILANCVALAILLRIDWESRQMMRGGAV